MTDGAIVVGLIINAETGPHKGEAALSRRWEQAGYHILVLVVRKLDSELSTTCSVPELKPRLVAR